jgi:hypothetical protein
MLLVFVFMLLIPFFVDSEWRSLNGVSAGTHRCYNGNLQLQMITYRTANFIVINKKNDTNHPLSLVSAVTADFPTSGPSLAIEVGRLVEIFSTIHEKPGVIFSGCWFFAVSSIQKYGFLHHLFLLVFRAARIH